MAEDRKIIFSFDDGPAPVDALRTILAALKSHNIKAEFYLLGQEVKQNPSVARLITNQGH